MSPRLVATTRELIVALEKDGFSWTRQSGSHAIYRQGDRRVVVAIHSAGDTIPIGTLKRIIRDAGWDEQDLHRLGLVQP